MVVSLALMIPLAIGAIIILILGFWDTIKKAGDDLVANVVQVLRLRK